MSNSDDDKLTAALNGLIAALKPFADGAVSTLDIQEVCVALEDVNAAAGATSMKVVELRRELQKYGFNKPAPRGGTGNG